VLELILLDRLTVHGCDGIAWDAAASSGDSGDSGEGAQRQEKSSGLEHKRSFGRGDDYGYSGALRAAAGL
jgi:hypothetical protein